MQWRLVMFERTVMTIDLLHNPNICPKALFTESPRMCWIEIDLGEIIGHEHKNFKYIVDWKNIFIHVCRFIINSQNNRNLSFVIICKRSWAGKVDWLWLPNRASHWHNREVVLNVALKSKILWHVSVVKWQPMWLVTCCLCKPCQLLRTLI